MNSRELLLKGASEIGVDLSQEIVDDFMTYLEQLKLWSKQINLTAIMTDEDIILKHFIDSLTIVRYMNDGSSLLDIGTGGGFPGVPVAIVRPDCRVICIDSVGKKIVFINHIIRTLKLANVKAHNCRAEDKYNNISRGSFDFVVTRAVSDISEVAALSLPYIKSDGRIILMRGNSGQQELGSAAAKLNDMTLSVHAVDSLSLPFNGGNRTNIILNRID